VKISVLTPAFGERRFIGACVDQFKGFPVDKHLVLCSTKPWFGDMKQDDSARVAVEAGAWVVQREWKDEDKQRLDGVDLLKDNDWILFVDADEYYTEEAIKVIFDTLHNEERGSVGVFKANNMLTYWRDWDTIIDPPEFNPVVAFRPGAKLVHIRVFDGVLEETMPPEVLLHHFAYVRTGKEVLRKIKSWGHAEEVIGDWYEKVWVGWKEGMTDFHPTQPTCWPRTKYSPAPKEIKDRLIGARKGYL